MHSLDYFQTFHTLILWCIVLLLGFLLVLCNHTRQGQLCLFACLSFCSEVNFNSDLLLLNSRERY